MINLIRLIFFSFIWFVCFLDLNLSCLESNYVGILFSYSFFESFLPFKLSSSFYHYKVFLLMLILSNLNLNYKVVLIFIPIVLLATNQSALFLGLGGLGVFGGFNSLLSNNLNSLHPPILYLSFSLLLGSLILVLTLKRTWLPLEFSKHLNILTVVFPITLLLGMWWAQLEGTWGGWWAWDPSENLILLCYSLVIVIFHLNYSNNYLLFRRLCFFLFIFTWLFYSSTQLGFVETTHSFVTTNQSRLFTMYFIFNLSVWGFFYFIKNYKINLFYSFKDQKIFSSYIVILIILILLSGLAYRQLLVTKFLFFLIITALVLLSLRKVPLLAFYKFIFLNFSSNLTLTRFSTQTLLHYLLIIIFTSLLLSRVFSSFSQEVSISSSLTWFLLDDLRLFCNQGLGSLFNYSDNFKSTNIGYFFNLIEFRVTVYKSFYFKNNYTLNSLTTLLLLFITIYLLAMFIKFLKFKAFF